MLLARWQHWTGTAIAVAILSLVADVARAQALPFAQPGTRYEISPTVQVDRVDENVVKLLDRVKALVADKQWGDAIDTLVQAMETSGGKLIAVNAQRYISVRDYCHLQLASLPPEALKLYRSRIDPQCEKLYREGVARRDRRLLLDVLDRGFVSSWGDNALNALGEMALESGDPAAARSYWERIIPAAPPAGASRTWLCVSDTDLDLAAIRARLVLASILEGSTARAREELARFKTLHPDARGRLGGREGNYATALAALVEESATWPSPSPDLDWRTFAGSFTRNKIAPKLIDVGGVAWRVPLRPPQVVERPLWGAPQMPSRVAENAASPLCYHPVVVGDLVFVNNLFEILAINLKTGKPAWEHDRPVIFEDQLDEDARKRYVAAGSLGAPRSTLTVVGNQLFARMGSAVNGGAREAIGGTGGYLVCLDLAAEGRLVWKKVPEDGWAFEGTPVADAANIYVAMRRIGILPHLHVACFDAQSGQLRWRQSVCAAESPAQALLGEMTHRLVTLHRDTLYFNTNLGAVAALSARDGRILWVSLYPRVVQGDLAKPAPHLSRDLTPCLYDRGIVYVAPSDSPRIFALEAATGQILWQTGPEVEDAVHLLGIAGDSLIASGNRLYWISLKEGEQGKVKHFWPDGQEKLGYGRGLLAGDCVLWPTQEKIYRFDQATARLKNEIALVPRRTTGGNLLVAGGRLLVATDKELIALDQLAKEEKSGGDVASENATYGIQDVVNGTVR